MSCAYLIGEEGWPAEKALAHYTAVRMRPGFGEGVSIPSQRRWIGYIERWARDLQKTYLERAIRIEELHIDGLREGVRVEIQGFVDEGKEIKTFHTFTRNEQIIIDPESSIPSVIFKPKAPIALPTNDVNIDFERRNTAVYGWSVVTSIAHVWFNAYFEGDENSGLFEIEWDAMDGIKGTLRKGMRMFDRLRVIWSVDRSSERSVPEPAEGESIPQPRKATTKPFHERDLGLERQDDGDSSPSPSAGAANSVTSLHTKIEEGVHIKVKTLPVSNAEEPVEKRGHKVGSVKRKQASTAEQYN